MALEIWTLQTLFPEVKEFSGILSVFAAFKEFLAEISCILLKGYRYVLFKRWLLFGE